MQVAAAGETRVNGAEAFEGRIEVARSEFEVVLLEKLDFLKCSASPLCDIEKAWTGAFPFLASFIIWSRHVL